jgi:hypothetical protein
MPRLTGIILILLLLSFQKALPQFQENEKIIRERISRNGQAVVSMPLPGREKLDLLARNVSISSLKNKQLEIYLSPLTYEWFISQNFTYTPVDEDVKGIMTASTINEAMDWTSYPSYTQYDSIIHRFAADYPGLCLVDTIGTTNYGKHVFVVKISDNVQSDEDEPETFYTAAIHGNETGGFILLLRLADFLLKNYSTSSSVKSLVDKLEIWINPLANPDGSYRTGNTISSPVRWNANGYDLNRNFPDPESDDPVKQIEVLDMIRFMKSRRFVISANLHGGAEVLNFPWDRWSRRHPDDEWFYHICRKYADTVHLHSDPLYLRDLDNGVTNGYDWYQIYGGRQDYVTLELQGREVTMELDNTKVTPASALEALWESNRRSLLSYIENADYGIHGKVTDILTGEPLFAKIYISGHDADNSHIFSDSSSGKFTRLLSPGKWDISFKADGYIEKIVSITVVSDQRTDVAIQLVPLLNPVDTITREQLFLYPNPANEFIRINLPGQLIGSVIVNVYNSLGMKVLDYQTVTIEDIPLIIDLSRLSGGVYTAIIRNPSNGLISKARFIVVHRE